MRYGTKRINSEIYSDVYQKPDIYPELYLDPKYYINSGYDSGYDSYDSSDKDLFEVEGSIAINNFLTNFPKKPSKKNLKLLFKIIDSDIPQSEFAKNILNQICKTSKNSQKYYRSMADGIKYRPSKILRSHKKSKKSSPKSSPKSQKL